MQLGVSSNPSLGGGQAGTTCPEHPPWGPFLWLPCSEAPEALLRIGGSEVTPSKVQPEWEPLRASPRMFTRGP